MKTPFRERNPSQEAALIENNQMCYSCVNACFTADKAVEKREQTQKKK